MAVIISIVQPNLEAGTYEGRTATDEGDGGGELPPKASSQIWRVKRGH